MSTEQITWTEAQNILTNEGFTLTQRRLALGHLLDGELELEQQDDAERVITPAELERARQYARNHARSAK